MFIFSYTFLLVLQFRAPIEIKLTLKKIKSYQISGKWLNKHISHKIFTRN